MKGTNPPRQRGMTLIGWLIVLVLLGVGFLIALRLIPVYLEAYKVRSVVTELADDSRLRGAGRRGIVKAINRRFSIEDVDSVDRDAMAFKDVSGGIRVVIDYERRVDMLGNLDGVASFRFESVVPN